MLSHMEPCHSTSFHIYQGVRQGAILSPLLYSIFVDELLDLTTSGLGVTIVTMYCGTPMYVDGLPLVADSPEELRAMLNIMHTYAGEWPYNLNADKSFVLVFGESPHSRIQARSSRKWYLGSEVVEEAGEVHHPGILRWFPSLPSPAPLSGAQLGELYPLHSTLWGLGLDAYTLLHPIDSTVYYDLWL